MSPNCRATHLCLLLVHLTSPRIVTPFAFTLDGPSRSWSIQQGINTSIVNRNIIFFISKIINAINTVTIGRNQSQSSVSLECAPVGKLQLKHEVAPYNAVFWPRPFARFHLSWARDHPTPADMPSLRLRSWKWRCCDCEVKTSESSSPIIDPHSTRQMCANEQWKPNIHKSPKNAKDHCSLELKRFQPRGTANQRHDTSFPFLFRGPRQCNRRFRDTRVYSVQLKHTKTKFHSFPARPLNLPVSPGVPAQAVAMNFKAAARMAKDRGGRYLAGSGWCRRKALGDCE